MRDFTDDLRALRRRLDEACDYLDIEAARKRLSELEPELSRPDLWDRPEAAQIISREYAALKGDSDLIADLEGKVSDAEVLFELGRQEADDSVSTELESLVSDVAAHLADLELRSLFIGEHDSLDAVCEIHAKDGGTDAQDWAEMLLRMYQRWVERRGFTMELDEVTPGQEAGILSATFIVKGRYAYGLLSAERGIHRLVRMSPFDSQHRRQTSFAAVTVVPFFEEASPEVDIDEKDLRIDTYRSSSAGGQHVNVTDSAVRITHMPSGIVVSCQNERSQFQNKARAMQILASRLAERAREERVAELSAIAGPKAQVGWGSQIRSYVMAPFQLVKDLRSDHETGNVSSVLDGDLEPFMEAYLRWRRTTAA
ncbi:MAG TPA: peptide chain release factor 2 [Acidimicrobiales bacterium]|nr:peptide chain release factor 2 [Acidimicrobiales bacterium]